MKRKILVADDEPNNLKMIESRLRAKGYAVLTAPDGNTSLDLARSERPDLVILDLEMPGKEGHEVCKALKAGQDTAQIPVILYTARVQQSDDALSRASGCDVFIREPYQSNVIMTKIEDLLKKSA